MQQVIPPSHTPDQVRALFHYNPTTGVLTRALSYGRALAGAIANSGTVTVYGRSYVVSRVCWCHYYGEWPPDHMFVDHKNRRRAFNFIDNLRLVTPTQNQLNKAGSGQYPKGVTCRNRLVRPWQAKIRVNGTRLHLGSFETMEEAAMAYRKACIKHHGEFACYD